MSPTTSFKVCIVVDINLEVEQAVSILSAKAPGDEYRAFLRKNYSVSGERYSNTETLERTLGEFLVENKINEASNCQKSP